ncbi:unnamed protein product [Withania somnifera]
MAKKEEISSMLEQKQKGDPRYQLVHSQVKKIKQEEKSKNHIIDLSLKQLPEMKMVLAREVIVTTRQRYSRSPLGLNSCQPIFVGDS